MARIRRVSSIKSELIQKSKESMLSAIQIFNNPNTQFKSESFIVLSVIAWTYLLHAYYRERKIEHRYWNDTNGRRRYDKTKHGAYKYWDLERCLNDENSPIDKATSSNLRFLVGLRHEIEHQMTTRIDDLLSARFQACCLNYNNYLKTLFGDKHGIESHLSFSLQFSSLSENQIDQVSEVDYLPKNISQYLSDFDTSLEDSEYQDTRFAYRVLFVPKSANRKGQADKVIEFIPADSEVAKGLNKEYVLIKDKEKPKYMPSQIWNEMQNKGYIKFKAHQHTQLWKKANAKDSSKGYGVKVANTWYWYDTWKSYVEEHCKKKGDLYK